MGGLALGGSVAMVRLHRGAHLLITERQTMKQNILVNVVVTLAFITIVICAGLAG